MSKKKFKTTITQKGQMTIPKPVREDLGLETDSSVELRIKEDGSFEIRQSKSMLEIAGMGEAEKGQALKAIEEIEKIIENKFYEKFCRH
ncbi:MAG: AbrB/MazE/SpoVT family DNA-binding domain-containing protein [Candidatus Magasanikbacteria bacterium]